MLTYCFNNEIDDKAVLEEIIRRKHEPGKSQLKKCQGAVLADYELYQNEADNLQRITPDVRISKDSKDVLINTYESSPKALQESKKKIKDSLPAILKAKCPYCMISAHSTFDHYLDKSEYPEYSLLSKNLIPSCAECNTKKGIKICDDDGKRMFVHFAFDKLPQYPFLKYDIDVDDGKIVLKKIYLSFQENEPINAVIRNHYQKLKLFERLKNQFDVEISTIIAEFHEYGMDKKDTVTLLTKRMQASEKTKGINSWETCILRAIVANDDVLSFLSKGK